MTFLVSPLPTRPSTGDASVSSDATGSVWSDQNAAEIANPVPVTADGNSADEDPMKALQQAVEADRKDSPK